VIHPIINLQFARLVGRVETPSISGDIEDGLFIGIGFTTSYTFDII
jgi:hypothetical protein